MATIRPGVQKPHCTAPASTNACWIGSSSARPWSRPVPRWCATSRPSAWPAATRQAHTVHAVQVHRAGAAFALLAGVLAARQAQPLAQHVQQALALPDVVDLAGLAVDRGVQAHAAVLLPGPAQGAPGQHRQGVPAVARRCRAGRRWVPRRRPPARRTGRPPRPAAGARDSTARRGQLAGQERLGLGRPDRGGRGRADAGAHRTAAGCRAIANEQTAITIALRVPTLANWQRPGGRRDPHGADQLVRRQRGALRPEVELLRPGSAGCRGPRRPRPSRPGPAAPDGMSPAGDAEPRLPPIEPRLRICGEPMVRAAIASPGSRSPSSSITRV